MFAPLLVAFAVLSMTTATAYSSTQPSGRIVCGANAQIGQFPHQVSLCQFNSHICGGSIIASQIILTAADCVTSETSKGGYMV